MQAVLLLIAYAKKPADLDLHCLIKDKSRFSRTMVIAYISNLNFVSTKSPYIFFAKKFSFLLTVVTLKNAHPHTPHCSNLTTSCNMHVNPQH